MPEPEPRGSTSRRADGRTPWWAHAVTYQVYVRSFADSNGDGLGDLAGIRSRLPYIAALGADAIWLNPCYPSPQRDHGYDITDYFDIDPDYGTLASFDDLVEQARQYGIRVLMDVVPNHCSSDHPWFVEALAAGPGSAARERFWFRDGKGESGELPPNDWTAIFGGSAWTRVTEPDGSPGQWYLGVFTPHQPDLNWHHPDVPEMFDRMLRFWFDRGVEGFRADAVTFLGKTEGLPDHGAEVPFGKGSHLFTHHPDGHIAWRRWRKLVDDYNRTNDRDVLLLAEAWTADDPGALADYVNPEEFHQAFAFDLTTAPWRADAWRRAIDDTLDVLRADGLYPAWTLNNHDVERAVTRYGRADATRPDDVGRSNIVPSEAEVDERLGRRRARAATLAMLALPGSVFLYAGEELGLPEVLDLPDEVRTDPVHARSDGRVKGRDGCRVPLPWTVSPVGSHGFSPGPGTIEPWLPQPEDWGIHSAEALESDTSSILHLYRDAVAVRRKLADLQGLDLTWHEIGPGALAFSRGNAVVVLNLTDHDLEVPPALLEGRRVVLVSDPSRRSATRGTVPGDTCVWLAP